MSGKEETEEAALGGGERDPAPSSEWFPVADSKPFHIPAGLQTARRESSACCLLPLRYHPPLQPFLGPPAPVPVGSILLGSGCLLLFRRLTEALKFLFRFAGDLPLSLSLSLSLHIPTP